MFLAICLPPPSSATSRSPNSLATEPRPIPTDSAMSCFHAPTILRVQLAARHCAIMVMCKQLSAFEFAPGAGQEQCFNSNQARLGGQLQPTPVTGCLAAGCASPLPRRCDKSCTQAACSHQPLMIRAARPQCVASQQLPAPLHCSACGAHGAGAAQRRAAHRLERLPSSKRLQRLGGGRGGQPHQGGSKGGGPGAHQHRQVPAWEAWEGGETFLFVS